MIDRPWTHKHLWCAPTHLHHHSYAPGSTLQASAALVSQTFTQGSHQLTTPYPSRSRRSAWLGLLRSVQRTPKSSVVHCTAFYQEMVAWHCRSLVGHFRTLTQGRILFARRLWQYVYTVGSGGCGGNLRPWSHRRSGSGGRRHGLHEDHRRASGLG